MNDELTKFCEECGEEFFDETGEQNTCQECQNYDGIEKENVKLMDIY